MSRQVITIRHSKAACSTTVHPRCHDTKTHLTVVQLLDGTDGSERKFSLNQPGSGCQQSDSAYGTPNTKHLQRMQEERSGTRTANPFNSTNQHLNEHQKAISSFMSDVPWKDAFQISPLHVSADVCRCCKPLHVLLLSMFVLSGTANERCNTIWQQQQAMTQKQQGHAFASSNITQL